MREQSLSGLRILVAEDEFMIATDLARELADAGATVLGPTASLEKTLQLIEAESSIDASILDINLQGDMIFPAADLLRERGVPFLFATGYDGSIIPRRFEGVGRFDKPAGNGVIALALRQAIIR
jgi:CheY-like chemotaxis protein